MIASHFAARVKCNSWRPRRNSADGEVHGLTTCLDPPRAGLGKAVAGRLAFLAPPRITIVSCDPATLARDLATLKDYEIEKLTLVDLFPQTYHLETVAHLRRK